MASMASRSMPHPTSPSPDMMRQIQFDRFGPPDVLRLEEAQASQPKPGEVRIAVHAVGINRADVAQRQGTYPAPAEASKILGLEVSGVVDALGEGVASPRVGEHVCALTPGGGYAEKVCVRAAHCLPHPHGLDHVQAAALPEAAMTVWSNVFQMGRLSDGESVLVHGGSSGIGAFTIALARAFNHRVLATVGSERKREAVESWGAEGINYEQTDFVERVLALTGNAGVDVVLDMVGGDYVGRNLDCLAMDGRILQIAFQRGADVPIRLFDLMRKRAVLTGSLLRSRSDQSKSEIASELREKVWPLFRSGRLPPPVIDSVYSMDDVARAHMRMESSQHIGKLILVWDRRLANGYAITP